MDTFESLAKEPVGRKLGRVPFTLKMLGKMIAWRRCPLKKPESGPRSRIDSRLRRAVLRRLAMAAYVSFLALISHHWRAHSAYAV